MDPDTNIFPRSVHIDDVFIPSPKLDEPTIGQIKFLNSRLRSFRI